MRLVIRGHGDRTQYLIDGRPVSKEEFDAACPPAAEVDGPAGASLVGWKPLASRALGVHPDQVAEATESARAKGVPTEFRPDGRPVFTCRSHRKRYLRAYGLHDNDGGYGD